MSHCKLRTPWPIHFKLRIVIGIDSLTVCILGKILIFHSRVMGLHSSNCRRFFVCRAVNWEPLRQLCLAPLWWGDILFLSCPSVHLSVCSSVHLSVTQFVSATPLKLLNRISWNLVGSKDTICSCAYYQEILISWILSELCPFEHRNFPKFTTEAACQCNSSETTEQNFMKLGR